MEKKTIDMTKGIHGKKENPVTKESEIQGTPVLLEFNSKGHVIGVLGVDKEVVVGLPRVGHGTGGMYPQVMIGGQKYVLGTTFENPKETEDRKTYEHAHPGDGSKSTGSSVKVDELNERLDKFLAWTQEALKDQPELMNKFEEQIEGLRPEDKQVTKAKALLSGMSPAQMAALKAMLGM